MRPMAPTSALRRGLHDEPDWPSADDRRPVFLLDASSPLERRILEAWIQRRSPPGSTASEWDAIQIPPTQEEIYIGAF